mgnify:CR=1 FL=1
MNLSRILISPLTLALVLAVPCISHAGFFDGYQLKEWSDASDRIDSGKYAAGDSYNSAKFAGYVLGAHDTLEGMLVCIPANAKAGQLMAVVGKYLRENPDQWDKAGFLLVGKALSSAFPCQKK